MAGYTKNIAVIRGIKSGFSADGGALSGLVKAEKYGTFFRAEISLINFAPLTQGRYITAVTDGENTVICEGGYCECQSNIETSEGFAAVVCFVNGEVSPVAVAVCGDMAWAAPLAVREAEKQEKNKHLPEAGAAYEDEAIAEDNYYEYGKNTQSERDVRKDKEEEKGRGGGENEAHFSLRKEPEDAAEKNTCKKEDGFADGKLNDFTEKNCYCPADMPEIPQNNKACEKDNCGAENPDKNRLRENAGKTENKKTDKAENAFKSYAAENSENGGKAREIPLADDLGFYERMRGEIEKLLISHPHETELEEAVENSRWVRINYGGKRFYVFGIIFEEGRPSYVCYGVPAMGSACPESLKGMAGFIPAGSGGYWVMYQDARTGASVKLTSI